MIKLLLFFFLFATSHVTEAKIRIGILAHKGKAELQSEVESVTQYLNRKIDEGVEIIPLAFSEIEPVVANEQVDFIFVNPLLYVQLEHKYGIQKILKIERRYLDKFVGKFGSVIFSRKDFNIKDMKWGQGRVAAVAPGSLGGWLTAKKHLESHGIFLKDSQVTFLYDHFKVVQSVLDEKSDVGIVRTGVLEELLQQQKIDLSKIKVDQHQHNSIFKFLTTSLYSEWPMASLEKVGEDKILKLSNALLEMSYMQDSSDQFPLGHWTLPSSYHKTEDLLRFFRIYPFDMWTQISFRKVIKEHPKRFSFIMTILSLFVILTLLFIKRSREVERLNKSIAKEKEELDEFLALTPLPLLFLDSALKAVRCNQKFGELYGDFNIQGKSLNELITGIDGDSLRERLYRQESYIVTGGLYLQSINKKMEHEVSLRAISQSGRDGVVIILEDLESQKKVELLERKSRLRKIEEEKVRSVGILGSGIAHEINNPLTIINSGAKILLKFIQKDKFDKQKWTKLLEDSIGAAERIAIIINSLRLLGKDDKQSPYEFIKIGKLMEGVLCLVSTRFMQQGIRLDFNYGEVKEEFYCSHARIHQILMNILINAETYVQSAEKKIIKIDISHDQFDYFLFRISNTGTRISKQMERDAFIPFSSEQKEVTGVGSSLASAKLYLNEKKADIFFDPLAENTTIIVKLPRDFRKV
jgi:two-component system sensor histidine kinase TtrS